MNRVREKPRLLSRAGYYADCQDRDARYVGNGIPSVE